MAILISSLFGLLVVYHIQHEAKLSSLVINRDKRTAGKLNRKRNIVVEIAFKNTYTVATYIYIYIYIFIFYFFTWSWGTFSVSFCLVYIQGWGLQEGGKASIGNEGREKDNWDKVDGVMKDCREEVGKKSGFSLGWARQLQELILTSGLKGLINYQQSRAWWFWGNEVDCPSEIEDTVEGGAKNGSKKN